MTEPENALTKQYQALVAAEGATLEFTRGRRSREIARIAFMANDRMENIGARRLHTVMSTLMEDVLFELPDYPDKHIVFDGEAVRSGSPRSWRRRPAALHPVVLRSACSPLLRALHSRATLTAACQGRSMAKRDFLAITDLDQDEISAPAGPGRRG